MPVNAPRSNGIQWDTWHQSYDNSLGLQARLKLVSEQIAASLNECASGPLKIISMCAGDGRDVINALRHHARRTDITAVLLDNHSPSLTRGIELATQANLTAQIRFIEADASRAASYVGIGYADLVLLSGFLGHVRHQDVVNLINHLPMLCKTDGSVIWSRHLVMSNGAERVPQIREAFRRSGFQEVFFDDKYRNGFAVGRARFAGSPMPLDSTKILFEFIGIEKLANDSPEIQSPALPEIGFAANLNPEQTIPACLEQIVALHPSRPAIGSGKWQPTYQELSDAVDSLARSVTASGAIGDRAAILMRHDAPQIASVLAALKAGRVAVVLNPTDPAARLRHVLDDAEPGVILTDSDHQARVEEIARSNCRIICFGEIPRDAATAESPVNPARPDDLAFLIYTSGSTGKPKAVMQTHRNVLHNAMRLTRGMNLRAEDRIALLGSLSGGQGIATLFCALANGAAVCPFAAVDKGIVGLADWIKHNQISVYVSSASLFRHLMRTLKADESFPRIHAVRLAAEAATAEDFAAFTRHFQNDCILLHTLSSSETGNITQMVLNRNAIVTTDRLPAGKPALDIEVLLLDDEGREVISSEVGEIAVKSRFISPGYWRNDTLTAQKFSNTNGLRIFRTGDLGKFDADGLLMHVGRKDSQVKIRGYRIELSEIEDALGCLPEIAAAAVCARATSDGHQIAAYVVARTDQSVSPEALRQKLRGTLPGHMVPADFIFLKQLPLAPGGKIDREALRNIEPELSNNTPKDGTVSQTEMFLLEIWRQVFGRDDVGCASNFFDLGGDSLKAAVIAAQIFQKRGIELNLRAFLDFPTVREMALKIEGLSQTSSTPAAFTLDRAPRNGPLPLSFQQEQLWENGQRTREAALGAVLAGYRKILGPLNAELLRECMNYLVQRHEMLRTTFDEVNGNPVQIVHPATPAHLLQFDFSGNPDIEERIQKLFHEEAQRPFDLRQGPLIRFTLVRVSPNEHRLLIVSHHIATDAWSWNIYFKELGILYEARLRGEPPPLPATEPFQYVDYAVWQRRLLQSDSPEYRDALDWWGKYFSQEPQPAHSPFARNHWWRKLVLGPRPKGLPLKRARRRDNAPPSDGWIWWGIEPETTRRLEQLAREMNATFYMVRVSALAAMLADECGRRDVSLGIFLTQRDRVEFQSMFGYFMNHAVLRFSCNPMRTFREWLTEVRKIVSEIQAGWQVPYEKLRIDLRRAGIKPTPFRVYCHVMDHTGPLHFGGLTWLHQERLAEKIQLPFSIGFDQHSEHTHCLATFDPRIYHPARVRRFLQRFSAFLDAVSRDPYLPISELLCQKRSPQNNK